MLTAAAVLLAAACMCAGTSARPARTTPDPALAFAVDVNGKTFVNKVCGAVVSCDLLCVADDSDRAGPRRVRAHPVGLQGLDW